MNKHPFPNAGGAWRYDGKRLSRDVESSGDKPKTKPVPVRKPADKHQENKS